MYRVICQEPQSKPLASLHAVGCCHVHLADDRCPPAFERIQAAVPATPATPIRLADYIPLAHALAARCFRALHGRIDLDEFRREALFGLAYAAKRFDLARGVPFGAYATLVIRCRLSVATRAWMNRRRLYGNHDAVGSVADRQSDATCRAEIVEEVDRVRERLPARWFAMLMMVEGEGRTLADTGAAFGVSGERVRVIVCKAKRRARQ